MKTCFVCGVEINGWRRKYKKTFCSKKCLYSYTKGKRWGGPPKGTIPWIAGKKHTDETRRKIKERRAVQVFSEDDIEKMRVAMRKRIEKNGGHGIAWKGGRRDDRRNDPAYHQWRKEVWKLRPGCFLKNDDCEGRLEAHHIRSWRKYPELRYEPKNGVILCRLHHPLKHTEEKRFEMKFCYLLT